MSYIAATIVLTGENSEANISVHVVNFPILPIGSEVDIYFADAGTNIGGDMEGLFIVSYRASSNHGTVIDVVPHPLDEEPSETTLESFWSCWEVLKKECIEDPSNLSEYLYPKVIDFSPIQLRTKN